MNCPMVRVRQPRRCAAGGGRGGGARGPMQNGRAKIGRQVSAGAALLLLAAAILVTCSILVFRVASARYVHPTYKFRSALDEDMDRLERQAAGGDGGGPARRQDFDNSDGSDDDDDDSEDQNTAASYQNQDDNGQGNNGGGVGATDGYDDKEPDGPYEETPVEQEGQADLERFFDDHLGASDRDGMDKENLPSNLVSLLSAPPLAQSGAAPLLLMPTARRQPAPATVNSITVMPMAPVANQQVRPISGRALDFADARDPFETAMSTVQETSFIRLPDEKVIVTHQVTARNRPRAPLKLARGAQMSDVGDYFDADDHRVRARPRTREQPIRLAAYGGRRTSAAERAASGQRSPSAGQQQQQQVRRRDGDTLAATGSEIVATEDEDDDRVYVTNATDRPFRIADLGGYDPEQDFIDAANELEVMATARERPAVHNHKRASRRPIGAYARRGATRTINPDDQYAWAASSVDRAHREPGAKQGRVVSGRAPKTNELHGDASEPDEVTFGQDDPYQTDLEAEMRQQEYDKISGWRREMPARRQAARASETFGTIDEGQPDVTSGGNSNVAVDHGERSRPSEDKSDDDELTDNEYRSEPRVEQTEARSTRARSRPMPAAAAPSVKRRKDEFDDEGGWANDGVEEMDIPSQAHQNSVLEKAAKKEEAARRAAADGTDQHEDQSGQAADGESERMPNADYMKDDLKEDDSGYAKAA